MRRIFRHQGCPLDLACSVVEADGFSIRAENSRFVVANEGLEGYRLPRLLGEAMRLNFRLSLGGVERTPRQRGKAGG